MISDIFRQTKHTLQDGDSSQEFYSFRLHSRGHLFLSVTPDRQLAVQQSDTPVDPQAPDDRCFVMHSVSNGSVFIQPYHHKGMLFCFNSVSIIELIFLSASYLPAMSVIVVTSFDVNVFVF